MWATLKKQLWLWRGILIAAPSVAGVVIGLRLAGFLQPLELLALDQFLRWRPLEPVDSRIVIVEINEADIRKYKYPISDELLAKLLNQIKQQNPRAIGLDIYRDLPTEPGHQELVKVFKSTPNLIGIQKVVGGASGGLSVNPPPELSQLNQVGANDLVTDFDGKTRRGLLSLEDSQGQPIYSLGAYLAVIYLEAEGIAFEPDKDGNQLRAGKAVFSRMNTNDGGYVRAATGGFQILPNFRNLQQGFRSVSMTEVLEGKISPDLLCDRLVLVGYTAESIGDYSVTPYTDKNIFGVAVHADLASQMLSAALDGRLLMQVWQDPIEWLWIFVWSLLGAALCWTQRHHRTTEKPLLFGISVRFPWTTLGLLLASGCLIGGSFAAFVASWWLPVVPALLGLLGSAAAVTAYIARSAAQMRETFGRYLTDEVVANLLETPAGLQMGGERRKVTVLISDLRGFSAISERLTPEEAVTVVNLYLEAMTEVIDRFEGTINDFIGDSIFVMFGAPLQQEDDTLRAIACAIAMQLEMHQVNQHLKAKYLPDLEMGIGIHTGEVLAGNIGSQRRAKYTVMGSHVNLASRIESYSVGGQVLISKEVCQEADSTLRIDGQMQVQLKGIQETVTIYDVGGVGDPFNLFLPKEDEAITPLRQGIPVQFTILEGKHGSSDSSQGTLVGLSSNTAELRSEQPLELLSNLRLHLLRQDAQAKLRGLGDIYAKVVIGKTQSPENFCIRFTAIPAEVSALFEHIYESEKIGLEKND